MSLIDEALRRAQAAQTPGPGSPEFRVPMPLPDPGRHGRRLVWRLVVAALVAAALVGGTLLLTSRRERVREARREPPQRPAPPTALAGAMPMPPATAAPTAATPSRSRAPKPRPTVWTAAPAPAGAFPAPPRIPPPTPRVSSPAPGRPALRVAIPTTPVILPPIEVSNASASPHIASEVSPRPTPPPPTPTASSRPLRRRTAAGTALVPSGKLELEGIVFSTTNPTALINGRVVSPGGFVAGFTVLKIEADRVELEGDEEILTLTLK